MKSIIYPSRIQGVVLVPSSKSYAQRAILAAAIANHDSRIKDVDLCDDTMMAIKAAEDLGCKVERNGNNLFVRVKQDNSKSVFFAGESGLTARLLTAILMIQGQGGRLDGLPGLQKRRMGDLKSVANQLGVRFKDSNGYLPFEFNGSPRSIDIVVDGSMSSQFVSGLLLALPKIDFSHTLKVEGLKSRPYIDMTVNMLQSFGVFWVETSKNVFSLSKTESLESVDITIEKDWSAASLMMAAGAIAGDVYLDKLNLNSLQADARIVTIENLTELREDKLHIKNQIEAFDFDATDCPDLFPPLVALGNYAKGECRITGMHRLNNKESNRGEVLESEFNKIGGQIRKEGDVMIITPSKISGGEVNAHGDHRIAMALTAAGLGAESEVTILGSECVSKSYPNFYNDMISLGAKIEHKD